MYALVNMWVERAVEICKENFSDSFMPVILGERVYNSHNVLNVINTLHSGITPFAQVITHPRVYKNHDMLKVINMNVNNNKHT